jgi:GTP-binding protein HflX
VDLGEGIRARVTDTVGFIRKLPHHLVASFRATLEEARAAAALLHIVDASHPDWEEHMRVVEGVLGELDLADRPVVVVFNKIDLIPDPSQLAVRVRELHPGAIMTTTLRTDGLSPLKARLRELDRAGRVTVVVRVPVSDGAGLAALYRQGEVLAVQPAGVDQEVTVRLERWQADKLRASGRVVERKAARKETA